jgi:hypothetical protein
MKMINKIAGISLIACIFSTANAEQIQCPRTIKCPTSDIRSCVALNEIPSDFFKKTHIDPMTTPYNIYELGEISLKEVIIKDFGKENQKAYCSYSKQTDEFQLNFYIDGDYKHVSWVYNDPHGSGSGWTWMNIGQTTMHCGTIYMGVPLTQNCKFEVK